MRNEHRKGFFRTLSLTLTALAVAVSLFFFFFFFLSAVFNTTSGRETSLSPSYVEHQRPGPREELINCTSLKLDMFNQRQKTRFGEYNNKLQAVSRRLETTKSVWKLCVLFFFWEPGLWLECGMSLIGLCVSTLAQMVGRTALECCRTFRTWGLAMGNGSLRGRPYGFLASSLLA